MNDKELIPEILLNIFRVLLYWSGYCVFLFLLDYSQRLFFMFEMYGIFADINYFLPNIVSSLVIALFILSFQNVRLIKKYKGLNR